jgi:hypothetical protein
MWTAIAVHLKRIPKSDHLIQTAHYSWKLDIPFTLLYTSRVNWAMQGFSPGAKTKWKTWKHVQYEEYTDRKTGGQAVRTFNLLPFDAPFLLQWDASDTLLIRHEQEQAWTKTNITKQGINDYYSYLAMCLINSVLPTRPSRKNVFGESEYDPCQAKYCEYTEVCKKGDDQGFQCWLDHARYLTETRGTEIAGNITRYLEREKTSQVIEGVLAGAETVGGEEKQGEPGEPGHIAELTGDKSDVDPLSDRQQPDEEK